MSRRERIFAPFIVLVSLTSLVAAASPPVPRPHPASAQAPVPVVATPAEVAFRAAAIDGAYTPPACTGMFTDVACPAYWAVGWIEQLRRDGITTGCNPPTNDQYCPEQNVTRAQMAVFLERMARGTANWPPRTSIVHAVLNADGSVNATASGQALREAIAAIPTSGAGVPTYYNKWVVQIGPGIFDLGTTGIALASYITLRGIGQAETIIRSDVNLYGTLTVNPGASAAMRDLAVWCTTPGAYSYAVYVGPGSSLRLDKVRIDAQSGTAINLGIYLDAAQLVAENSWISASGPDSNGIYSIPPLHDLTLRNCTVTGGTAAIDNAGGSVAGIATSTISGPLLKSGTAVFYCFQNYSLTMAPVACP